MFLKHEDVFCVPYFYWKLAISTVSLTFTGRLAIFIVLPVYYIYYIIQLVVPWIPSFKWVIFIIIVQLLLDVLIVHNWTWLYTVFVSSLGE